MSPPLFFQCLKIVTKLIRLLLRNTSFTVVSEMRRALSQEKIQSAEAQRDRGGGSGSFMAHGGNFGCGGGNLVVVDTLVEEEAMIVEFVAAEVVVEVVMVGIMVAAMVPVLVTVVEKAMVVMDQHMEINMVERKLQLLQ